jgi:protein TonB
MDGGVEGGVVGGVPDGVLGGVIGGTGTGPVPVADYDEPARVVRATKPDYPHEGFISKTQGTVLVEALIDTGGQVARTRIVESIPRLDAAAVACVRQWVFMPAKRRGRPVASTVVAAITFRIY